LDQGHDARGHVRVYEWNGNNWTHGGQVIQIQGVAASNQSEYSVSLFDADDGNTIAIGAISNEGVRSSV
jgi:hypothetical protein